MPIERELKFVLKYSPSLMTDLRKEAARDSMSMGQVNACSIEQGYLNKGSRVRKISPIYLNGIPSTGSKDYYRYTYKHKLTNQTGDLELEFDIDPDDFKLAWAEANRKLYKVRIELPLGEFYFELDFFYESRDHHIDGLAPYLVLAELELRDGHTPETVRFHPIITKYLAFKVPEGDDRFSNRKLGDPEYVAKVLAEVTSA